MAPDSVSLTTERKWRYRLFRALRVMACVAAMSATGMAGQAGWTEVRSPNFRVYTDGCEKDGHDVALRFEEMRAAFSDLMQQMSVETPTPLQIVAFRDSATFRRFAPLWNGRPTEVGGLFIGGAHRSFILIDLSVQNPWQVVFHEYAHQLIRGNVPAPVEPWFDEGFAEYFSTITVNHNEIRAGSLRYETLVLLGQSRLMKTADLLRVRSDSRTYRENGHHQNLFYAQSALLTNYLINNNLLPKAATYLDLIENEDYSPEQAVQEAFGMNMAELDAAVRSYLRAGDFPERRLQARALSTRTSFRARGLTYAERDELLTDIYLQAPDYREKTAERLEEQLRRNPADTAAARGLGYFYLQNHDLETAQRYFQKAAAGNSQDPRVHYYAAYLTSHRGNFGERAELPGIVSQLRTAIRLDPAYADAYALLGGAYLFAGDTAQAVSLVQQAIALNPRNEGYRFKLAQIHWLTGRSDDAVALLRGLVKAKDTELAAKARRMLLQARNGKRPEEGNPEQQSRHFMDPGEGRQAPEPIDPAGPVVPQKDQAVVKFLKGTVTSVDCSRAPSAVMTVVSGVKTWMMRVPSSDDIVLIGADKLSCAWSRTNVAVNYREVGDGEGNVISLEVQ